MNNNKYNDIFQSLSDKEDFLYAKLVSELKIKEDENNVRALREMKYSNLNLSSNDYLGLNEDVALKKEFLENITEEINFSSSSSRLINGNYKEVVQLEKNLNKIYGKESIVMNSGYSANKTIISTFFKEDTLILTDRLNHASIYDGIFNSKSKFLPYRHLDTSHLEVLLKKYSNKYKNILVITETIYSMDGDMVSLKNIVELKKKYKFYLMVDEAHSYGVHGYGVAYEEKFVKDIDFLVIPLGKGGGSVGAYIILDEIYREYLINFGREFIYSTALPPINNLWNLFILKKIPSFAGKREKLRELTNFTLEKISSLGINTVSTTHIIGLVVGDNEKVSIIANNLKEKGYNVYPIKSPTVPKGEERIRISLHPNISKDEINEFLERFILEFNKFKVENKKCT